MNNKAVTSPVAIGDGIYWVGSGKQFKELNCNPYLIIDGEEGVLIDPGSSLDFEEVFRNVTSLLPLEKIRYIVLQHQDPDFCSSTPLFEQRGFKGEIATHWRAATLIQFYGVTSAFYLLNKNDWVLKFGNNRILQFYQTPYLHFPGAIVTYDALDKILFSSDLFGALSRDPALFSDQCSFDYIEAMKSFHEHYMPSNAILRPVMEMLLRLDIDMIAPQHGSIIRHDVQRHIETLRDLECGRFLRPLQSELSKLDGHTQLINQVLKRYRTILAPQEIATFFQGSDIIVDPVSAELRDFNSSGEELWQRFFEIIYSRQGSQLLTFIEPLVRKLAAEYTIELPQIFNSAFFSIEQSNLQLLKKNQALSTLSDRLEENLLATQEALLHCPLTKLRNEHVFRLYLSGQCKRYREKKNDGALLLIGLDNLARFNLQYGKSTGDEALKTLAVSLSENQTNSGALFKLDGPVFACQLEGSSFSVALQDAEKIRYDIENSDRFLTQMTVSIGLVCLSEFSSQTFLSNEDFAEAIYNLGKNRLQQARQRGMNQICTIAENNDSILSGSLLLIDNDPLHLEVLSSALHDAGYFVFTASDGENALEIIEREKPQLIISELFLPKIDAFQLRKKSKVFSDLQQTPFILLSHLKDVDNIKQALALDIEHYLQKPYLLPELIGLVALKFRQRKAGSGLTT